jgi:Arc/MetJ family transcription regulator
MEGAVSDDLVAQVAQRLARHEAQEMVPLQDLVQQDAVEEAAQRDADHAAGDEQRPRGGRERR